MTPLKPTAGLTMSADHPVGAGQPVPAPHKELANVLDWLKDSQTSFSIPP